MRRVRASGVATRRGGAAMVGREAQVLRRKGEEGVLDAIARASDELRRRAAAQ